MNCSRCNSTLECINDTSCWCCHMPILKSLDKQTGCMCKTCLIQALSNQYAHNKSTSDLEKKQISKLGVPNTLIEGVDFHINAQGLYTFTSWYLLRRGYCCENNCQNCPY